MTDVMYKRYERNKQGKKKQAYTQKVQKGNRHKKGPLGGYPSHLLYCPVTFM